MKSGSHARTILLLVAALAVSPSTLAVKKPLSLPAPKPTPPEASLRAYVQRVRAQQAAEVLTPGSIWSPEGRLVRLGTDAKAVRLHDVVSIVVTESLAASTDGQVKNSRASNANSGLTSLFGALKTSNNLQNLLGMTAASGCWWCRLRGS
jgi:flagellar L-ring protein precursor FlgH